MQQGNANYNMERELAARKGEAYRPGGPATSQRPPSRVPANPQAPARPAPQGTPVRRPSQNAQNYTPQNSHNAPNLFDMEDDTAAYRQPSAHARADGQTRIHRPAGAGPARQSSPAKRPAQGSSPSRSPSSGKRRSGGGRGGSGGSGGGHKSSGGNGKKKPSTAKYVFLNIVKSMFVLFCVGLIVVSMLGVSVARYLVETTQDDDLILDLNARKSGQTGFILAKDPNTGEWLEYQKLISANSNSIWVPLHQMPQNLKDAVISTEDRDFENHGGFSVTRTLFAAFNQVFHVRDSFGGSTIDQQLVKNLTGETEASGKAGYERKLREIYRAVGLNNKYSKDMILESYLNTLPLSGTIIGVQAAAKEYFYKDVGDLELHEAAMIAGITQAPGKYDPYLHPDACKARRDDVILFMYENEKITEAERDAAWAMPLGLYEGGREADEFTNEGVTSYFADTVFEEVINDLVAQGVVDSREAAVQYYYNQGLRIESTVDLNLQNKMEEVYELGWGEGGLFPTDMTLDVEVTNEDGTVTTQTVHAQSAMAVMDYDGALKGIVGGLGEKKESLGLNRAYQSPRPIGSTMKPLTSYALGIDYGIITYSSRLMDAAVQSRDPSNPQRDGEGNIVYDWPFNYGEKSSRNEWVLVYNAVAQSKNTVPALVGTWLGQEALYSFLRDSLYISTLVDSGDRNDHSLAPLVLGALTKGISAYELAAAYAIFGGTDSYGTYTKPRVYERVLDSLGNIILEPDRTTTQAIRPESAYIVNRLLSNVLRISGGTANGMALSYMDSVAKTGTTTDDKDRWFVGLTPYYVSTVWWGYDTNQEMNWPAAASTNPPPNVWKTIMEAVQANLPEKAFPDMPAEVVERQFCTETGLVASANCPSSQRGYYTTDNIPEVCNIHDGSGEAA